MARHSPINLYEPAVDRPLDMKNQAGAFGIPESMPPIGRRDFYSKIRKNSCNPQGIIL